MNEENLFRTAQRHHHDSKALRRPVLAFVSGGTVAVAGQLILEGCEKSLGLSTADSCAVMVMTVTAVTVILTGCGVYDRLAQLFGAGLFIPISGFANSLASCALEGKSEGFVMGIGSMMFRLAGSVLSAGFTSAVVFGIIRWVTGL